MPATTKSLVNTGAPSRSIPKERECCVVLCYVMLCCIVLYCIELCCGCVCVCVCVLCCVVTCVSI